MTVSSESSAAGTSTLADLPKKVFVRLGILPFLLVIAVVVFTILSDNFLTGRNLLNVLRQSVFLTIVSMGQMLALLTGGFDLSVGTTLALTSVVGAMAMAAAYAAMPDAVWLAIFIGCFAGIVAGTMIGLCNGIGVAFFGVSPFMMSLTQRLKWSARWLIAARSEKDSFHPDAGLNADLIGQGVAIVATIPYL